MQIHWCYTLFQEPEEGEERDDDEKKGSEEDEGELDDVSINLSL